MAHRTLPEGIRQETVSYRGHQVVITYDATAEKALHIWIETNGSVKRHLIQTGEDTLNVFDGQGRPRGELLVGWDALKSEHLCSLLSKRDLED